MIVLGLLCPLWLQPLLLWWLLQEVAFESLVPTVYWRNTWYIIIIPAQ